LLNRPLMRTALVVLLCLAAAPALAQPREWHLQDESVVRFMCRGEGVDTPAKGRFAAVNGRVVMNPDDLGTIRGRVDVVLSSIRTDDSAWDTMFRAASFLAIDEHPRASFELFSVEGARAVPDSGWAPVQLRGRLTLKGVDRQTVVRGRVRRVPATDGEPERVELLAIFPLEWTDHDINVPENSRRDFAGSGAYVRMHLVFTPA
jgi:polyisoprenoid-binding protein YceI